MMEVTKLKQSETLHQSLDDIQFMVGELEGVLDRFDRIVYRLGHCGSDKDKLCKPIMRTDIAGRASCLAAQLRRLVNDFSQIASVADGIIGESSIVAVQDHVRRECGEF